MQVVQTRGQGESSDSERQLLVRAQVGGARAYGTLVERYQGLVKIASNLALDRLKSARRRGPHEPVLHLVRDERFAADAQRYRDELGGCIERAMALLSDEQRAVFVMREVHGLPYTEIAEILGLSPSGARVRMFRAKEILSRALVSVREACNG